MPTIKGIAFYPQLVEKDKFSGKYNIKLGRLESETVKELQKQGIEVKHDNGLKKDGTKKKAEDIMGDYIVAQSDYKAVVRDSSTALIKDEAILRGIGNGSYVKLQYKPYKWSFGERSGTGVGLQQLMIIKLVSHDNSELTAEDDGWKIEDSSSDDSWAEDEGSDDLDSEDPDDFEEEVA